MASSDGSITITSHGDHSLSIGAIGSIGGNLNFGNQYTWLDSQFFEPTLDEYHSGEWVDPPETPNLINDLAEHHLLILSGELDDPAACAQHLGFHLRERLAATGMRLTVRQRSGGSEPQRIESAFAGQDPVLLLLIDATPSSIAGFQTLGELRRLLRSVRGYALITTRGGREEWDAQEDVFENRLWRELDWYRYYGANLLTEFLRARVMRTEDESVAGLFPGGKDSDWLVEDLSLTSVVKRLKSPTRIRDFAAWLRGVPGVPSRGQILEQIALLEGHQSAVENWYRKFGPRDQLLVLALTLFDGLSDDLVFMGLERLIESTWRAADPLLPQFDYQDLKRFSAYFHRVETAGGASRIDCSSPLHRRQLLDLAWSLQRRRLLAALPVLTQLIRSSARASTDEALAATSVEPSVPESEKKPEGVRFSKREALELHSALVESLSLVSRLSFEVVEPYFLDLAADPAEPIRQFVARALASWWSTGHREELLRLLRDWWEAAVDYEREDSRLDRLAQLNRDPRSAVRAVIALVVGYAARFERPNQLSPALHDLLAVLIEDTSPTVRQALRSTISLTVAWHFRQLEPLLRTKVLRSDDLFVAVAEGAAEACSMRPDEGFSILDTWRMAAKAERWKTPMPRERLLATVALTNGFLRCDDLRPQLRPEVVGARLRSMLTEEIHPYVRRCAFFAVEIQVERNLGLLSLILKDLLSAISVEDRPAAVEIFVRSYLHQRLRLVGGDDRIEVGGSSFAIWTDGTRPMTEVESILYGWILDSHNPVAQQLSVDVFEALAETAVERLEQERRLAREPKVEFSSERPTGPPSEAPSPTNSLPLLGRLAAWLAVPRKKTVRSTLTPLLAELIYVQRRPIGLRTVLSSKLLRPAIPEVPARRGKAVVRRWRHVPNESTQAIARNVGRALEIYRWRWWLIAASFLLMSLLTVGSIFLYRKLTTEPVPTLTSSSSPAIRPQETQP